MEGSKLLGIIELGRSFKNLVDLFDRIQGQDQSLHVFLENGLEAFNSGIFTNDVRIWACSFRAR